MSFTNLNISEYRLAATKGVLCVIFGLITLFLQDSTYVYLIYTFGLIALVNGLVTLILLNYSIRTALRNYSFWHYESIGSVLAGILVFCFPEKAIAIFTGILGVIAIGMGIFQALIAVDWKQYRIKEGLFIVSGCLTVFLGLILFKNPSSISSFVSTVLGLFFALTGGYITYFAYKGLKEKDLPATKKLAIEEISDYNALQPVGGLLTSTKQANETAA